MQRATIARPGYSSPATGFVTSRKISFSDGRYACSSTTMPSERLTARDTLSDTSQLESMMKDPSFCATL